MNIGKFAFGGQKFLLALALLAGLCLALPALGAAVAPSTGAAKFEATSATLSQPTTQTISVQGTSGMYMPCAMMDQNSSQGVYKYPCDNFTFQPWTKANRVYGIGHEASWFGLMLVITVALVWAVLLLLIMVLWKILQKHKNS